MTSAKSDQEYLDMKQQTLTTNGLVVAEIFPVAQYESIYSVIKLNKAEHRSYNHFAGAWNAMAYRYQAALDHGVSFASSIQKDGSTPPPQTRYMQERVLFDYFSSCFSMFEAAFYGLYAIGTFIDSNNFSLKTEKDQQKVSPSLTKDTYARAFPADPIINSFMSFFSDPAFQQIREIRNILTHRTSPGRTMYVSIGEYDAPPTEWKLNNVPVDESIVKDTTQELSRLLSMLLAGSDEFVNKNVD